MPQLIEVFSATTTLARRPTRALPLPTTDHGADEVLEHFERRPASQHGRFRRRGTPSGRGNRPNRRRTAQVGRRSVAQGCSWLWLLRIWAREARCSVRPRLDDSSGDPVARLAQLDMVDEQARRRPARSAASLGGVAPLGQPAAAATSLDEVTVTAQRVQATPRP